MKDNCILTAESVSEGHPDKLCDTIADAVVDACLTQDAAARVACDETKELLPLPVVLAHRLTHLLTKLYPRKWTRDFDPWPRSADTHLTHRVRSAAPVL